MPQMKPVNITAGCVLNITPVDVALNPTNSNPPTPETSIRIVSFLDIDFIVMLLHCALCINLDIRQLGTNYNPSVISRGVESGTILKLFCSSYGE